MIIVYADDSDGLFWTATAKSSPATRRIPIVFGADAGPIRERAVLAGADLVIKPDELLEGLPRLVRDYARVLDAAQIEQLDCECQEPLPELARQGVEKFNAGEYYKQHDLFEALWMETDGPVRDLYRAILQVGVAYFQIERGNYLGALKMLQRSVQWLAVLPDECQGVDVAALRTDSYRVRAELERLGQSRFAEFDHRLLRPVRLTNPSSPPNR
jgi:predicted metal-dependent hydrolase